MIHFI